MSKVINYLISKNSNNIFYSYSVIDADDVNKCPICWTSSKEDAVLIAKALNNYIAQCSKGV